MLRKHGFTLIELLIVIGILVILGTVSGTAYYQHLYVSRDANRLDGLQDFRKAIEGYYQKYQHYPPACGVQGLGYQYFKNVDCSTSPYSTDTGAASELRFSNSLQYLLADGGLLDPASPEKSLFYSGYVSRTNWTDPLSGYATLASKKYNCRYVIEKTSASDGNNCPTTATYKEIQKYYLHCALEKRTDLSKNTSDGGKDRFGDVFELYSPSHWINCLYYFGT